MHNIGGGTREARWVLAPPPPKKNGHKLLVSANTRDFTESNSKI